MARGLDVAMRRRRKALMGLMGWPPTGVDAVLWYMGFTDAHAAPLTSPHTAALDGHPRAVGQTVLTQTDGQYSTSGGNLVIPTQATPTWGDQGFIGKTAAGAGFARAAGLAFAFILNKSNDLTSYIGIGDGSGISVPADIDGFSAFYPGGLSNKVRVLSSAGVSIAVSSVALDTPVTYVVVVRSSGYFFFVGDNLVLVIDSGTLTPVYPVLSNYTSIATMPTAMLAQLNTDLPTIYPSPLLSDGMSDASAPYLTDGKGHNEGNEIPQVGRCPSGDVLLRNGMSSDGTIATNAPTPGVELLTNGDFSAWTADDPDDWNVSGESGSNPEVSEVATGEAHADAPTPGGEHCNIYTTGSSVNINQSGKATVGNWYLSAIDVDNVVAGSLAIEGIVSLNADYVGTYMAIATNYVIKRLTGLTDVTIPSVSLKEIPRSELYTASPQPTANPIIRASLAIDDGYQRGCYAFVDDVDTPTAGVECYLDGNDDKVKVYNLATSTEILSGSVTASDEAILELYYHDDKLWVYYNGAAMGNVAYTPAAGAIQCGGFMTGCPTGDIYSLVIRDATETTALAGVI